ncbi:hypothetical protein [sulfur-oxidizing endosymbiont of Gigantopelta aegis]|uniref:hypothetical protein n=1 Tax=sulfur-oxidizing endosymbiont of Gigantopelta aegis TaxID=2794934 RepID=UPI0018DD5F0D
MIKGSAVNNDGRSLGIMAPNPQGQVSVIKEAYKNPVLIRFCFIYRSTWNRV